MNTYNKKAISELEETTSISKDDLLLVSQFDSNGRLISKKAKTQTVFSNCVKKIQDNNTSSAQICGGNTFTNSGAELILNGKNNVAGNGTAFLIANDGVDKTKLTLRPDNEFYIQVNNGENKINIARSINNNYADKNGNITLLSVESANKLTKPITISLSGDLSGFINFDGSSNINLSAFVNSLTNLNLSNIQGELSTSQIIGLGDLAFKDKALSSDIIGLGNLAFKDKVKSNDIDGNLPITKIENLDVSLLSKLDKDDIVINSKLQTGTEIAKININGNETTIYAPEGSDTGDINLDFGDLAFKDKIDSNDINGNLPISKIDNLQEKLNLKVDYVSVFQMLKSGTEIAKIDVDGEEITIYAPEGSGSVGGVGGVANIGIGSVIAFAGENIPDNTLLCDGREVSKTDYEALWLIIGDKYGETTDSSKFKLPNLNERFIEGISYDLSVGQQLEAGLPNIEGTIGTVGANVDGTPSNATGAFYPIEEAGVKLSNQGVQDAVAGFDASKWSAIYGNSGTVQPPAVLMKYVIVYKQLEGGNVIINTEGGSGGVIDGTVLRGPISQEIPSNCTSYVIESGRFNSSTGTTDSDDSKNDSWYRKYSDGWCEQGGYISNQTFDYTTCSVSLIKTFNNTNYAIQYSIDKTNNGVNMSVCYTTNKTTNSFEILKDNAQVGATYIVGNISWEAKGFIN